MEAEKPAFSIKFTNEIDFSFLVASRALYFQTCRILYTFRRMLCSGTKKLNQFSTVDVTQQKSFDFSQINANKMKPFTAGQQQSIYRRRRVKSLRSSKIHSYFPNSFRSRHTCLLGNTLKLTSGGCLRISEFPRREQFFG